MAGTNRPSDCELSLIRKAARRVMELFDFRTDTEGLTVSKSGSVVTINYTPDDDGGGPVGDIEISDVTGLQAELDGLEGDITSLNSALSGKADTSHSHAISDVTSLQTSLDGKAAVSHTHSTSDITGLGTLATQNGTFSGTSSGTNTGDNAVNSLYSGLVSNATHTGDVTGSTSLTIANDAVTNAKLANVATSTIKGRVTGGTGDPEDLTATQVRTLLNVANGANNYSHPNHSGDVTSSGDGATTIANNAVTNAKAADMAANTIKGRITGSTGDPEDLTAANVRTIINVENGADVTDAANVGSSIHGATAKTTPVDADTIPLIDSAASNALKKVSWLNIKATLKTHFDTLYNLYVLPVATTTVIGGVKRNTGSAGQYVTGFDSSGNVTYDTPATGAGVLVKYAKTASTSQPSTTSIIPLDATIPQISEGTELITITYTPTSASSDLEIEFTAWTSVNSITGITFSLFVDSTANALSATTVTPPAANYTLPVVLRFNLSAGSTSARTYRIRYGPAVAATAYVNRRQAEASYGGVSQSLLTVKELTP